MKYSPSHVRYTDKTRQAKTMDASCVANQMIIIVIIAEFLSYRTYQRNGRLAIFLLLFCDCYIWILIRRAIMIRFLTRIHFFLFWKMWSSNPCNGDELTRVCLKTFIYLLSVFFFFFFFFAWQMTGSVCREHVLPHLNISTAISR